MIGPVPPDRYTCRHCGGPIRIARWRKTGWKHTNGFAWCVEPYPTRPATSAEPKEEPMDADEVEILTARCERCPTGAYEVQVEIVPGQVQFLCRRCMVARIDAVLDGDFKVKR